MAYHLYGSRASRERRSITRGRFRTVILLAFLAVAVSYLQGQNPTTAPAPRPLPTANPVPTVKPGPAVNLAFRLDHFLCYVVEPVQFQRAGLSLLDQFNLKPRPFVLTERQFLCNPVSKNGEPVHNPRGHLTGYVMKEPDAAPLNIPVVVTNQFGNQRFLVLQQTRLFVPTGKILMGQPTTAVPPPPPIPAGLDHYACYTVRSEGTVPHPSVVLSDQFGRLQGEVVEPLFLCNPAEKLVDNRPTGKVIDARDHLMCYSLKAGTFQPRRVQIHNQFETISLEVARPEVLCVPSLKEVEKK